MKHTLHRGAWAVVSLSIAAAGCGSSSTSDDGSGLHGMDAAAYAAGERRANSPVTKGTDVEAWLAAGSYKSWRCETMSHGR